METIRFTYRRNLWDEFELNLIHPALGSPFELVIADPARLHREVEAAIALCTKSQLEKYLSVVTYAQGAHLIDEQKQYLQDLKALKRYLSRHLHLVTIQRPLAAQLPRIWSLLPNPLSRNYPSQLRKYQFFQAVTAFRLETLEPLITNAI